MAEKALIRVALDAMGGDYAPLSTVKGAVEAISTDSCLMVKLYGNEALINKELSKYSFNADQIEVCSCTETIENNDHPVHAVRNKKDSSLVRALYAVRKGEADACVSCGNTGALLVGGQTIVGRIKGIERSALAFIVPSLKGPVMIIDCGASVDAKPEQLVHFAKMASVYMSKIIGIESPRVGLISIGEEEEKGNALVQETFPLLKECKGINFIGNVESRGITAGSADVVVCDAFVGNVILKMYEGVAAALLHEIKGTMMMNAKTKLGALLMKKELKATLKTFSHEEYGGAPMLGLKALVVKTHGNSKSPEIRNTILQCRAFVENDIPGIISRSINEITASDGQVLE